MPSTHLSLHYHVVFSAKDRARIISRRWMKDLHGYLAGIITNLGGVPEYVELLRKGMVEYDERYLW